MHGKSLQQMMPDAWPIFFRHRNPRPLQAQALPPLLSGNSILLSGPTASGKTEAVVAPLYQRHISFRRRQLAVIYVAPTKALVNDLYSRLDTYFGSKSSGMIRRYTGDHHEFADPYGTFLLLTTPEALDSLQLLNPAKFVGVRAVVVDEIHLLHGNARGQQLRHVLNRIQNNCHAPIHPKDVFQRVGVTATIDDMDEVCRYWLGDNSATIAVREQREIALTQIDLQVQQKTEKAQLAAGAIREWLLLNNPRKVIVFGNSRNGTQSMARALHESLGDTKWPVYWHTGILSKGERERIEEAMKGDRFGVCVATSTLEVGVDIGDVDAVILYDPPLSVGSFLQRIGRGNRKTDICRVVALCSNGEEIILIRALYHCAVNGILDDTHEFDRPSVRFQQVLSFAWKGISRDKTPLRLKNLAQVMSDEQNDEVVSDMLTTGGLHAIGDALVPSDYFMDQGERRLIHTVIAGGGNVQITDGSSGEALFALPRRPVSPGLMFVRGEIKKIVVSAEGVMSLERTRHNRDELVQLPTTRGKRWLSRKVVWAIAELSGEDPRIWKYESGRITTWGGEYNKLLVLLVKINCPSPHDKVNADEYSLKSLYALPEITPKNVKDWASELEKNPGILPHDVSTFGDNSRYFQNLGVELQRKEVFRSIPFRGFIKWLDECVVE